MRQVGEGWAASINEDTCVFCAFCDGRIAAFCFVSTDVQCILKAGGSGAVGGIRCVGTLPEFRGRGVGLRMVDLATLYLKNQGCSRVYIDYTLIDKWYAKLGYEDFARFSLVKEEA